MESLLKVELVTFDCAQTLVEVAWTLDGFARDCMSRLGLELPEAAYSRLLQLYVASLPEYLELNMRRDPSEGEEFWKSLTANWFAEFGVDETWLAPSRQIAHALMYGPEAKYFRLFSDVKPCLDELQSQGIRLAVVSNWDYTLHLVLRSLGIHDRFEVVLASLEEGVEKPAPGLFEICLDRLKVSPGNAVHVGDDPIDDVVGAAQAKMQPILLMRSSQPGDVRSRPSLTITSLSQLPEVLPSIV